MIVLVEGMAQTAGILVGEARNFAEKVILAKIGRATFHRLVRPGDTLEFSAKIEQLNEAGASISEIQHRLGHESAATTSMYLDRLHAADNPYAAQLDDLFGIGE